MPYTYTLGDTTTTIIASKKEILVRIENVRNGECLGSVIPQSEKANIIKTLERDNEYHAEARAIINMVAREYWVLRADMISKDIKKPIPRARHVAFYLLRKYTDLSYPQIGGLFDKCHAAVIHANNATKQRLKSDKQLAEQVKKLEGVIAKQEFDNDGNDDRNDG